MAVLNKLEAIVLCVWIIAAGGWTTAGVARANAPLPDCTPALITLQGCILFVTGQAPTPTDACCASVLSVHQSNPACLCVMAEDDTTTQLIPGYKIDLAGELPSLCKLSGLSQSQCPALLGENVTAPALAPGASAPGSPSPGAAHRLTTSANLFGFIFTYLGIVLVSSALISFSKY